MSVPAIQDLDVNNLVFDLSDRTTTELTEIDALAENIKAVGLVTPIVVSPIEGTNTFKVVAGKRRLAAVKKLGLPTIQATIFQPKNGSHQTLAIVADNFMRKDVSPVLRARAIKTLLDNKIYKTHAEVATALGVSQPTVSNWMAILNETPDVQDAINVGELAQKTAKGKGKRGRKKKGSAKGSGKSADELRKEKEASRLQPLPDEFLFGKSGPVDRNKINVATSSHTADDCEIVFKIACKLADFQNGPIALITSILNEIGETELLEAVKRYRIAKGYVQA